MSPWPLFRPAAILPRLAARRQPSAPAAGKVGALWQNPAASPAKGKAMRPRLFVIALALVAALAGCDRLTPENYDKLRMGMRYGEVKEILGDPARCSDLLAVKACTWGDDKRYINVNFVADQVVLFNSSNLR